MNIPDDVPATEFYMFPLILVLSMLVLKLLHLWDVSFVWVFAPIWFPLALFVLFVLSATAWGVLVGLWRATLKKML